MRKSLIVLVLSVSGCLATSTKTDLDRPDFSKPAKEKPTATSEPVVFTREERLILDREILKLLDELSKENNAARARIVAEITSLSTTKAK